MVPSFYNELVRGVASCWMEFFAHFARGEQPGVVFVPLGLGSDICACAAARAATDARTRIVGVVSAHAQAYKLSFEAGRAVEVPVSTQLADGMACRVPEPAALETIRR
jgi:threonine dehydratase